MKLIAPLAITDARLSSSDVPENDHPEYAPATTYADGDKVIVTDPGVHRIYESLQGGNQGNYPPDEDDAEPPTWWLNLGATNRWKMFDGGTGTATTQATSLTVELLPGSVVDAIALFGLAATSVNVTVTDPTDGEVYNKTVALTDNSAIDDYYDWFFAPIETRENLALLDLPPYGTATIAVTVTGATARCALLVIGKRRDLGLTLFGSSLGIVDYSRKDTDEFGNFMITERRYGYRPQFDVWVDTPKVGMLLRTLAGYRATPVVWVGSARDEDLVYGYYRDFTIVRSSAVRSDCTIDVEGL